MRKKELFQTIFTAVSLITLTTAIFLYAGGYRLRKDDQGNSVMLKSTGLVSVKSIPQGANVYINGVLATATNNTIAAVEPGKHTIKVIKNGYAPWSKEIEVFPELATDITAVLISQSPRLEPLTNTGADKPTVSPTFTKLAFLSSDSETPGIWVVSLSEGTLNLFRSSPNVVLKDTSNTKYSQSSQLEWSPDEKFLLIELETGRFQLFNLVDKTVESIVSATEAAAIRTTWDETARQKRAAFIEKLDIPQDLQEQAISKEAMWAPDGKKFLYKKVNGDQLEHRVYNSERPLPVGELVDALVFTTAIDGPQPQISWYADSFHLILTEGNIAADKRGSIFMIRIDGTNKTEIYNSAVYSDHVFSTPGGDKIVVLTSFKSTGQTDLYTIGLR
ncbi:MAG: PEGA domain-containing protein [bacterium]